jgi:hypothetical protein
MPEARTVWAHALCWLVSSCQVLPEKGTRSILPVQLEVAA